jgi:anaerobic magnesium-protoporphyrin IX monomethyl ester cyclase
MTVMGGPQLRSAIAVSKAIREKLPARCRSSGAAPFRPFVRMRLNAPYVDYAVRGQGEDTLVELLAAFSRRAGRGAASAFPG